MTQEEAETISGFKFPLGWSFIPVHRRGEVAGFFCTQGAEIHCFRIPSFDGHWLTRQDLERRTRPIFEEYGFLLTKVGMQNLQGHSFVKRLGFHAIGQDDHTIFYKAERLNHARL